MKDFIMSTATKLKVPRTFKPLSRSAYRWAQKNFQTVQPLGSKQNKWVNALASGKYNKGRGFLSLEDTRGKCYHCCLGVACDLSLEVDAEGFEFDDYDRQWINGKNSAIRDKYILFNTEESVLPDSVRDEYKFKTDAGEIDEIWAEEFQELDAAGEFNDCESLREFRRYVKTFFRLLNDMGVYDLTEMNDGRYVYLEEDGPSVEVVYSHKQIAEFVKAYPQAVFKRPI